MKKVFPFRGARREEGMALLFALGFLAMMLILGLGFVTTSLLAQKLAANNSSRAQARMFARSAAARAMLGIMLYNDQAVLTGRNIENYDVICSYDRVPFNRDGTRHPDADVVDFSSGVFLNKLRGDDLAVLSDQLCKSSPNATDGSKLKYSVGTEDYSGETSSAKWMYFYDAPEGTDGRRIIGRAAFQVLPRKAGRLSLYGVSGGANTANDYNVVPYKFRWGRGVEELNLDVSRTLPDWSTKVSTNNVPSKYQTLYTSYGAFFTADEDIKKKWVEYWFAEGTDPVLKDAFPTLDRTDNSGRKLVYYNRFNISGCDGTTDKWYDRFKWEGTATEVYKKYNAGTALDDLTSSALPYRENDTNDNVMAFTGLPFLKRIGNDKGTFVDSSDGTPGLVWLRRQIAANFNDYCDPDSIPTSDIKADEWSVTDANKFPKYTGNEKTLYINEVALKLDSNGPLKIRCGSDGALTLANDNIRLSMLLELINMYDGGDDWQNPARLKAESKIQKCDLKVAIHAKFEGKVVCTKGSRKREYDFSVECNKNYDEEKYAVALSSSGGAVAVNTFGALSNGYSVGESNALTMTVTQPSESGKNSFAAAVDEEVKSQVPSGWSYGSFRITSVEVDYKIRDGEPKLTLSPVLLKANETVTVSHKDGSETKIVEPGVDFVRFDPNEEMSVGSGVASDSKTASSAPVDLTFAENGFFIGGMEVADPRQNLNPGDWTLPTLVAAEAGSPATTPSMIVGSDLAVTGGAKNAVANPSAPGNASAADKETATDPAWRGSAKGQHVSTAYIRNSPMASPWELGLIHRAREWQTLNLKRAGGFGDNAEIKLKDIDYNYDWTSAGTKYENGDGAILEFIKTDINCRSMGKIPLTDLSSAVIDSSKSKWNGVSTAYNKDLVRMLFAGVRVGQTVKEFYAESTGAQSVAQQGGTAIEASAVDAKVDDFIDEIDRLCNLTGDERFRMRSQFLNSDYGAVGSGGNPTSFTFGMASADNDAEREELIGKTVNLLSVNEETPPNIFKVVVVAQTIKDIGGIGANVTISKKHNGENRDLACQLGRFDFINDNTNWENNTYFDEITGEVKALVTIERVPATDDLGQVNADYGRMVITSIEFVD